MSKTCGEMTELAEGARLEIVLGANNSHVGSNPTLSAIFFITYYHKIKDYEMRYLQWK
jgi:hypothetical protein